MEAKDKMMELIESFQDNELDWSRENLCLFMFKAGQESRCDWHKPLAEISVEAFTEGKQAGIKEVVEFIEGKVNSLMFAGFCVEGDTWQAKLKEWGLA